MHAVPVPCAEVEPAVAEELIGLLEKAAANPKPASTAAAGDTSPTRAAGGKAAGGKPAVPAAAAVPGMVGAGLMGMPDLYMMVRFASPAAFVENGANQWPSLQAWLTGVPDPDLMV